MIAWNGQGEHAVKLMDRYLISDRAPKSASISQHLIHSVRFIGLSLRSTSTFNSVLDTAPAAEARVVLALLWFVESRNGESYFIRQIPDSNGLPRPLHNMLSSSSEVCLPSSAERLAMCSFPSSGCGIAQHKEKHFFTRNAAIQHVQNEAQ